MRKREPYEFTAEFERTLVVLSATRPRFYGRLGKELDPELFPTPAAGLAIKAVHEYAKELGRGPTSLLILFQRLRRWVDRGDTTNEEVRELFEYLEEVDEKDLLPEDEVAVEVAPVLQQRAQDALVRNALDESARVAKAKGPANKRASSKFFERVQKDAERAQRIGAVDTSIGIRMGVDSFDEIKRLRRIKRLPTGVAELDLAIGGLPRSAMGVVVGGPGDGKSMWLSHQAAQACFDGMNVLYATLEIPEGEVLARIKANLTGVPIDAITHETGVDIAKERLERLSVGLCVVKEFPPHLTQVGDIRDWLRAVEDIEDVGIDLLIVDYADRMGAGQKSGKEVGDYQAMRIVYEQLRQVAVDREIFCWTASQATRSTKERKRADVNNMADSMHKGRIADLVITLNVTGDAEDEIGVYVAKHRTGKSKIHLGPFPHDFAHGCIVPVNRKVDF